MIQIGAPASPTLFSLLSKRTIDIDTITVYGSQSLDVLHQALSFKPVLLHDISNEFWLNYEDPFDARAMTRAREMLTAAKSPWFSTGIGASAEPQGHTTSYWRGADASALQSRERVIENIIRNGRRLREWVRDIVDIPLLLENYNYHPTNAYEYVCEPDTFSGLIEAIGCEVLLDVAHAWISAHNMGWGDPRRYLEALPLSKVREIHINRPGFDAESGQMIDRHQPLQAEDVELLMWLMERCSNLQAVTLESDAVSEERLMNEVMLAVQAVGK